MNIDISQAQTPGLLRRLAALFYDGVLLFGILLLAAGLVIVPYMSLIEAAFPSQAWWFRGWLLAVIWGFFAYFWTHGGQTLGMRAWRLRLVRTDGAAPTLRRRPAAPGLRPGSPGPGGAGALVGPDRFRGPGLA